MLKNIIDFFLSRTYLPPACLAASSSVRTFISLSRAALKYKQCHVQGVTLLHVPRNTTDERRLENRLRPQ